ncbi:uncharacterized protein [Rutidosis leptorrhynchoides]|uniref:uncharacterized protein n=1 Tax=Rutidosis leptorrhynchoides TaxID=125765 RepID=UPI003A99B24A
MDAKFDDFLDKYPVLRKEPSQFGAEEIVTKNDGPEKFEYKLFTACKPLIFNGELYPILSTRWLDEIEETFVLCECPKNLKVLYANHQLKSRGLEWWKLMMTLHGSEKARNFPWEVFRKMFMDKFAPEAEMEHLRLEFMSIEHGKRSVAEYTAEFNDKSKFCPEYTSDPNRLKRHYIRNLNPEIKDFIDPKVYDALNDIINRALEREQELKYREVSK